ncbi:MAG: cystatin domain-containing protein [Trichlorobacter sp.]|uniref:cystatin domain-containing protein n=1 Tax=Trichlorobacter sp. TaxID=2911007 RepID=UPI002566D633|nr:cystatin domain-containing protein [Trichlorobacter sp.]MDK9718361.1 cystatin domain-containing protein [Trichlorobacter sp.]
MKKLSMPVYILMAILFTGLLGGHCLAGEQISGGKSSAAVTKPEVIAAADFAVSEQAKVLQKKQEPAAIKLSLVSIISAEEQVVSGMNYHLKLKVKLNGKVKRAEATVWWQPWNKETPYRLTSWKWK